MLRAGWWSREWSVASVCDAPEERGKSRRVISWQGQLGFSAALRQMTRMTYWLPRVLTGSVSEP